MASECPLLRTLWLESPLFVDFLKRSFGKERTFEIASSTMCHVHHIFGGKTRKDLPSNTITICAAVHDFCHAWITEGRIACLWWKLKADELDWLEINEAAGYSVPGWLDSCYQRCAVEWQRPFCVMHTELIESAYPQSNSTCPTRQASTATGGTTVAEPTSARKGNSFAESSPE